MWDLVFIGISATFFILFVSTFILLLNNLLPLHLYSKFHCILCNFFYSNVFSYYFFVSKVLTPICLTSYAFQQILPFNKSFKSHLSHLSTNCKVFMFGALVLDKSIDLDSPEEGWIFNNASGLGRAIVLFAGLMLVLYALEIGKEAYFVSTLVRTTKILHRKMWKAMAIDDWWAKAETHEVFWYLKVLLQTVAPLGTSGIFETTPVQKDFCLAL